MTPSELTVHVCPPPCEHEWVNYGDHYEHAIGSSVVCSKCGARAIDLDMLRLP